MTWVCTTFEAQDKKNELEAQELLSSILVDAGGVAVAHDFVSVLCFVEAAEAVEAAVVAQWKFQRSQSEAKARIGIHIGDLSTALELVFVTNGNQIIFTQEIDIATNGMLDARLLGNFKLSDSEPVRQLWLSTDSRPKVDARPVRLNEQR
tara:strand:- start:1030 stop:1479 length:450 start_codon:yes stop_codon:yes gene_type:complete